VNIQGFGINLYLLFHPVFYAYLAMLAGLLLKDLTRLEEIRISVLILTLAFIIPSTHKYHRLITNRYLKTDYDFSINDDHSDDTELTKDTITLKLEDIVLFDKNKDTVMINSNGKYTLLETWNEKCPPCLKAMKDLELFYSTDKFIQKYVYVRPNKRNEIDYIKLFESKLVNKKPENHLVDEEDILFNNGIQGTPYFLLFDPAGKLVFKQLGYSSATSNKLKEQILYEIGR
jgi:thioredoxin-related protein